MKVRNLVLSVSMACAALSGALVSTAAMAQAKDTYKPTKRGGGGPLKMLWWQGPTLLNPHFAVGTKDQEGSRIFYEPLAGWDNDGNLVPALAAEIPSKENGGVAADLTSITWKLQPGLLWSDGTPVTSADAKFTWEYCTHPEGGCAQGAKYEGIKSVETRLAESIEAELARSTH